MASPDSFNQGPLGDGIREILNAAMEDPRRQEIQLGMLDDIFASLADGFSRSVRRALGEIFNVKAMFDEPEDQNLYAIQFLTSVDPRNGQPLYSPMKIVPLPIATGFTTFTAADIKALPGYIELHRQARAENVAISVLGLTPEERNTGHRAFPQPPMLIIDAAKSYEEGALENSGLYPDLPPVAPPFDRKPGQFHL